MSEKWLFNGRVHIGHQYCPLWERGGFGFYENGGRGENEVFDFTLVIGRHNLGFTLWTIGRWERLLRWMPLRRRRGLALWLREPKGASDD